MAPVGLDNHVHVFAGFEADAQPDDHFGIGYARAQILLGDDGVYLDVRFE